MVQQREKGNARGFTSRNWCFTWNNYPDNHRGLLNSLNNIEYLVFGYEVAPKTGTPHLQGFIHFKNEQTFGNFTKSGTFHKASLKGKLPGVYWKPMYSTPDACIKYCKKGGDVHEQGTPPSGQGFRTDMENVCSKIVAGASMLQVAVEHPQLYVKNYRGFEALSQILQDYNEERPSSVWFYGRSGVGKTDFAFRRHGRENVYIKQDGTPFFIGYNNEQVVVVNEFDVYSTGNPQGWHLKGLLQMLDKYPFNVHVKGSQMKFTSMCVYITSSHPPSYYFKDPKDLEQVTRRLDAVYEVIDEGRLSPCLEYECHNPNKAKPCTFTTPLLDNIYKDMLGKAAQRALSKALRAPAAKALPESDDKSVASFHSSKY
nr:MAG: replication associated protein [Arizlama virus]